MARFICSVRNEALTCVRSSARVSVARRQRALSVPESKHSREKPLGRFRDIATEICNVALAVPLHPQLRFTTLAEREQRANDATEGGVPEGVLLQRALKRRQGLRRLLCIQLVLRMRQQQRQVFGAKLISLIIRLRAELLIRAKIAAPQCQRLGPCDPTRVGPAR